MCRMSEGLVISCEHGGNKIPPKFHTPFKGMQNVLESHRGWDPGALEAAELLSRELHAPLHFTLVSRLLIEFNRSPDSPELFSEYSRQLPEELQEELRQLYYGLYRGLLKLEILNQSETHGSVLHLSIHSFTPELNGEVRQADIGLLYDPDREGETDFCNRLEEELICLSPRLRIRHNYPYLGTADGFTTGMRRLLPDARYKGIEIEINQSFPLGDSLQWEQLKTHLLEAVRLTAGISSR